MTTQMMVRIDQKIKNRLEKLARLEGKTTSEMVRELIEEHLKERDIGAYIDDLWSRIETTLKARGVRPADIDHSTVKGAEVRGTSYFILKDTYHVP